MTGSPSPPNHHFALSLAIKLNEKYIIYVLDLYIFQSASYSANYFEEVSFEPGFEQRQGADYVCLAGESSRDDPEFQSFWSPSFYSLKFT